MTDKKEKPVMYLGDAVYAIFDGFGIWLYTDDHRENYATSKIYLEPEVLKVLSDFAKQHLTP